MSSILIEDTNFRLNYIFKYNLNFMDTLTLKSFIPEIFFSIAIVCQLLYNVKIVNNLKYNFPIVSKEIFFQTLFILACLVYMYFNLKLEGFVTQFLVVNDEGTRLSKIILLLTSIASLFIIHESFKFQRINFFEFYIILSLAILSLLLMISTTDLLLFYLVMEMQALAFYVLAAINRNSTFSVEAGLKYFISGSFISGCYLLGTSFVYGSLGTTNFHDICLLAAFPMTDSETTISLVFQIGAMLITFTLLFKIACAPFHFWAPDVYDGAPIGSTLIFSVLPKFPIFYFFIKWLLALNTFASNINIILLVCGVLSTFVGTFFALSQTRLKRLVIYSSIAQTGFLVAGLSTTDTLTGMTAVYFFLLVYIITSILIWGFFILFHSFNMRIAPTERKESSLYLSSLTNFYKINSFWSFCFVIVFFSIAGIPPFGGFLAKMLILNGLVDSGTIFLYGAIALIIVSSISVYYYIRLIKVVFFEPKASDANNFNPRGQNKINGFTVIFYNNDLDNIYFVFAILLFCLLILFFFPSLPLAICQYIALHTFGV